MAQRASLAKSKVSKSVDPERTPVRRFGDAVLMAREQGLLAGARTHVIRGRMPAALVEEAKRRSGIASESRLIEAALANMVAADNYGAWLRAHRGTISPDVDLEF